MGVVGEVKYPVDKTAMELQYQNVPFCGIKITLQKPFSHVTSK
jgi:hypothetical protein